MRSFFDSHFCFTVQPASGNRASAVRVLQPPQGKPSHFCRFYLGLDRRKTFSKIVMEKRTDIPTTT